MQSELDNKSPDKANKPKPPKPPVPPKPVGFRTLANSTNDQGTRGVASQVSLENHVPSIVVSNAEENETSLPTDDNNNNGQEHTRLADSSSPGEPLTNGETTPKTIVPSEIVLQTTADAVNSANGGSINIVPKAVMAREESFESVENEVCCSNLASYFVHKAKALAHPSQTKNKKVPPPKPPKPKKEDIERARKRLSSFGEEIPGGREGFRYADDESTESSVDYKDVIFENGRILAINRFPKPPKSDSPEPDEPVVTECDYEPLDFYQQNILKSKGDASGENSECENYAKRDTLMNDLSCTGLSKHSSEITLSDHLNNNFSEKLLNDQSSIGKRTVASENIFYDACENLPSEKFEDSVVSDSVESIVKEINRNEEVPDATLIKHCKSESENNPVEEIPTCSNKTDEEPSPKENPTPDAENVEEAKQILISEDGDSLCNTTTTTTSTAADDISTENKSQVDLNTQNTQSSQDDSAIPKECTVVKRRSTSEEHHSWPVRSKKTGKIPPERPPPPRRKCLSMSDDDTILRTEKVKPPRPPPPTPPTSLKRPNKGKDDPKPPPRRSKTVELTPETLKSLQDTASSVRRSVSFTERSKQKPDLKAMYSTIDTSKKQQSYDKMKFRPLPPPPAPPRTHSRKAESTTPEPPVASDCSFSDKTPVESCRLTDNTISLSPESKKNSTKATKTKPTRQSKPDLKIYTQDIVLADENANLPVSSQNSFVSHQIDNIVVERKKPDKADNGGKPRHYATSTFYCDNLNTPGSAAEDRSKSPSPMVMRSRVTKGQPLDGTESEVSGINADVESSPNSSRQVSVERTFSKSKKGDRSSVFYYDIPQESKVCMEKSVQTSPDLSSCQVTDKGEDSDELMNIANDIRRELNSILQRRNNMESTDSDLPSSQDELPVRGIIRGGPGSSRSSEVSWQESSDESENEVDCATAAAAITAQPTKSLSPEEKKYKKLRFIANELMSSEATFVDALRLLNVVFCDAVKKCSAERGSPIVPDEVMNHIFRFLPQLQNLNENLLDEIKHRTDNWDKYQKISDVIVKIGPFLKLYSSYIREFESVTVMLDEACRKYPHFGQLVSDFEKSSVCQKLALKHYLLKPVQRIPQYRLLLEDYLHNLTPASIDYEDTVKALQIVSEVANHANETMKQGDNFLKLVSIQNSLMTHHEIVKPGRVFLKEGELMKLSRRVVQSRWFILFNDSLLYLTPAQQGLYRINHELPLTGMRVSVPMQTEYRNEFSVISVTRSFSLAAKSAEERDEWITDLTRAIEENAVKRSSFINSQKGKTLFLMPDTALGKQAPVWIPDSRVTMCQLCTTEFTITYRRHHCRACGRVVCSHCSQNKESLHYLDNQPARVCDACFEKLNEDFSRDSRTLSTSSMDHRTTDSEQEPVGISRVPSNSKGQGKKQGQGHRPKVLQEVRANDQGSDISGHLFMRSRRAWKRFWFVVKDKVLYTYKASEDVAAMKSLPLLGFNVKTTTTAVQGIDPNLIFLLTHDGQPDIVFHAESVGFAERWIKAIQSATVL